MITFFALVVAALTSATTLWFVARQTRAKTVEQIELEHAKAELERLRTGLESMLPVLSRSTDVMAELAKEVAHETAAAGSRPEDSRGAGGGESGQGPDGGGAGPSGHGDRPAGSDAGGGNK